MKSRNFFLAVFISFLFLGANAQIFYKIEGNNLPASSYLFGTHHMAPLTIVENYDALKYLNETERVVGEIDMTQDPMQMVMTMQSHMIAPADSVISKLISPEDYAEISKTFEKYSPAPGMPLQMFDNMKPVVIMTMVSVGIMSELMPEYNPEEQLDTYFQTYAIENNKSIIPLETADFQASVLYDSTPLTLQAEALVDMLKNPEELVDSSKQLNEAYENQDLNAMLVMSEDDDPNPEFMIALLDRRNADWLTKIPDIIKEAPSFIAVGALHLAGENGLVEGLRKQGFTLTPINYNNQ